MTYLRQMNADLVRSAGDQIHFEHRPSRESLTHSIASCGRATASNDRHPLSLRWVTTDWSLNPSNLRCNRALHERDVGLLDASCLQLCHEARLSKIPFRHDQQA
jgi:hypothetical protein